MNYDPEAMKRPARHIALLRGINVTGRNKILMADLRDLGAELGWADVQTYIQSGNVVFSAPGSVKAIEKELEEAIERRFGLSIPVLVRTAREWSAYLEGNPFPEASVSEPNRVMLALAKSRPRPDAAAALVERCTLGERIIRVGDALWIHFPRGVGKSKLSPALLDRLVGSPVTTRNWRTVLKLGEMVGA